MSAPRLCAWCQAVTLTDPRAVFCGQRCRQSAFRLRRRQQLDDASSTPAPRRFAYADPPYPGLARRYYADQPSYAGEVDHAQLIARLEAGGYAGWALSTSEKALRRVLSLCPEGARVCPWVKPHAIPPATRGIHNAWEPLIIVGGRQRRPGRPDWLRAYPARGGGDLPGRKPLAFAAWLFGLLGMQPGDELDDLYPGTGIIGRAWAALSSGAPNDVSPEAFDDPSRGSMDDVSTTARGDESAPLDYARDHAAGVVHPQSPSAQALPRAVVTNGAV